MVLGRGGDMEAEGRSTWEILKVLQGVPRGRGCKKAAGNAVRIEKGD